MINQQTIAQLIRESATQNLTITLPTHKKGEEVQQNLIRFKNLLADAEKQLATGGMRPQQIESWLSGAHELLEDPGFWNHTDRGLVLYINDSLFRVYQLPYSVREEAYLDSQFLITPLLPMISLNGSWHVLAVSQKNLRLLRCTRESVEDVTPDDIFTNIEEFIEKKPEAQIQFHTGAGGKEAMFFGHGGGGEEKKLEARKYLHGVEESVTRIMKASGDPLMIAATEEVVSLYRSLNKYDRLLEVTIPGYPGELKNRELQEAGWEVIKEHFLKEMYQAIERFGSQQRDVVSSSLSDIVESTVMGKTDTLFIAMDESRWGRYDDEEHTVHLENGKAGSETTELLNWTALKALDQGARVYVLPRNEMPDGSEIAALYRF